MHMDMPMCICVTSWVHVCAEDGLYTTCPMLNALPNARTHKTALNWTLKSQQQRRLRYEFAFAFYYPRAFATPSSLPPSHFAKPVWQQQRNHTASSVCLRPHIRRCMPTWKCMPFCLLVLALVVVELRYCLPVMVDDSKKSRRARKSASNKHNARMCNNIYSSILCDNMFYVYRGSQNCENVRMRSHATP